MHSRLQECVQQAFKILPDQEKPKSALAQKYKVPVTCWRHLNDGFSGLYFAYYKYQTYLQSIKKAQKQKELNKEYEFMLEKPVEKTETRNTTELVEIDGVDRVLMPKNIHSEFITNTTAMTTDEDKGLISFESSLDLA
jgi:hypothetical protein